MADSLYIMPFGKYKGEPIEDLETNYLEWISEQEGFLTDFGYGAEQIGKELAFRTRYGSSSREAKEDEGWNRRNKKGRDNF